MCKIPIILFCLLSCVNLNWCYSTWCWLDAETQWAVTTSRHSLSRWHDAVQMSSSPCHHSSLSALFRSRRGLCCQNIVKTISLCDMPRLLKCCLVSIKRFLSKNYLHLSLAVEYFMFALGHQFPILMMMGRGLLIFGNLSASQQSEPVSCSDH